MQGWTKHAPIWPQINHNWEQISKYTPVTHAWEVVPGIDKLCFLESAVSRISKNGFDPFCSFHFGLWYCIKQLMEQLVMYIAHQFDANQELLECYICSWAELKTWWQGYLLNNIFWIYGSHTTQTRRWNQTAPAYFFLLATGISLGEWSLEIDTML